MFNSLTFPVFYENEFKIMQDIKSKDQIGRAKYLVKVIKNILYQFEKKSCRLSLKPFGIFFIPYVVGGCKSFYLSVFAPICIHITYRYIEL